MTALNCVIQEQLITAAGPAFGGGINNSGTLALTNGVITGNSAVAGAPELEPPGAAFLTRARWPSTPAPRWRTTARSAAPRPVPGPAEGAVSPTISEP